MVIFIPRQLRKTGEYLHVIVRGIGKQILFEDAEDNKKYLLYLQKYAKEAGISILAYCLMENHVHLLIHDQDGNISVFMKKMGVSYAQYFNRKYERTGHLFQDRFKSEVIKNEVYLLSVYRYILNNPVKAGICRAAEYPWSSYQEYKGKGFITDTEILRKLIGNEKDFRAFMRQSDETEHMESEKRKKDDKWAQQVIQNILGVTSSTQLQQFDRIKRDEALALLKKKGLTVRQLERLTGINRGVIQKAKSCQ